MEAELYDEKKFSDLTIQLANGVAISVHKIVLCRKNEYFNSMCGPESRFAVSHWLINCPVMANADAYPPTGKQTVHHRAQR